MPGAADVLAALDRRADEMFALAEELVAIDSTNPSHPGGVPGGEARCTEVLGARYEAAGLEIHRVEAAPGRPNLVGVRRGSGGGRSLILNGHLDTVPPAQPDRWTLPSPWTPTRRDGALFGLGAADMKASAGAMWAVAAALEDAGVHLRGELQLHAVVGEEAMEHEVGTSACLRAGFIADAAIVTEPTASVRPLTIAVASPRYVHLRVTVRGRSTHHGNRALVIRPGGPGRAIGVNALEKAVDVVRMLQELERQWGMDKTHPCFPPGAFTLFPGVLHADPRTQPVPVYFADEATLEYGIFGAPDESREALEAEVEAFVIDACQTDPWLREHPPELEWGLEWPPALVSWDEPVVGALAAAYEAVVGEPHGRPSPQRPAHIGASTDATWLQRAGIPTVHFGPGRLQVAHGPDEHVPLAEVRDAARVLAMCVLGWCG